MRPKRIYIIIITVFALSACSQKKKQEVKEAVSEYYTEEYRPQYHFTPDSMWMNDPNGMVYYEGEYHLFYQYYPDSTIWGPMHWGHAISTDLIHWEHLPIALYPDRLGDIFSGSSVIDWQNTTGFGSTENPPMIAIFTYHNMDGEKAGEIDYQTQGIAYSLDKGRTWSTYQDNPVLANPGIKDFRDPKVSWYEAGKKWIMTLAVKDHISFYSSPDLKIWKHESDFGFDVGGHGGVWECPDLFAVENDKGIEKWILLVSINPGGPNGGSATQYFIGDFNGSQFKNENPTADPLWLDFGKDNYAGVTWSDIREEDGRRIFLGWMSNWQYAQIVPTEKWRSGMTLPRELRLLSREGRYLLAAKPVEEIHAILNEEQIQSVIDLEIASKASPLFESKIEGGSWKSELLIHPAESELLKVTVKNPLGEEASFSLNLLENRIEFDRTQAGKKDFSREFAVPILGDYDFAARSDIKVEMYWDQNSFEIFVNDGEFQMTNLVFPNENWDVMEIFSEGKAKLREASYVPINRIW